MRKHYRRIQPKAYQTKAFTVALLNSNRAGMQRTGKKFSYRIVGAIGVVGLIIVGQLALSNYFVTKGGDLATLTAKKETLREEKDMLKTQLATITSLYYITQQAQQMGFSQNHKIVFAHEKTEQPVALTTSVITR